MPLVLLLRNTLDAWTRGIKALEGWGQLSLLEELVIGRARGAFLTRWFGRGLPMHEGSLRIALDNLGALRRRWSIVTAPRRTAPSGLNLTEPLAGLGGLILGMAASPTGWILYAWSSIAAASETTGILAGSLWMAVAQMWGTTMAPWSAILGGAGAALFPVAAIGALFLASDEKWQNLYTFLGAAAEAVDAGVALAEQLMGPRGGVRNPLTRAVLEVMDELARMIPFLLAAVAVVVVDGAAWLRGLAAQIPLLYALAKSAMKALAFVLGNLLDHLIGLVHGKDSVLAVLDRVLDALMGFFGRLGVAVSVMLEDAAVRFGEWWLALKAQLADWFSGVKVDALAWLRTFPVFAWMEHGIRVFGAVRDAFASAAARAAHWKAMEEAADPPGIGSKIWEGVKEAAVLPFRGAFWAIKKVAGAFGSGKPSPSMPSLPVIPDLDAMTKLLGGPPVGMPGLEAAAWVHGFMRALGGVADPFAVSVETAAQVEAARHPESVFAPGLAALRRERGGKDEQRERLARDLVLRESLYVAVISLMPEVAGKAVGALDDLFMAVDRELYDRGVLAERFEGPVREIEESDRLRPVVGRLRVRARGMSREAAQAWSDALATAMQAQTYLVPAGA